jgi:ABC-2 type transport system permease protein
MSRLAVIGAIIRKDLLEFTRDRLYVMLSLLGLVMFIVVFWVLPSTVDETLELGVCAPGMETVLETLEQEQAEGLRFVWFGTPEELRAAVEGEGSAGDGSAGQGGRKVPMGVVFPGDFLTATAEGRSTVVTLVVDGSVPAETRAALSGLVREIAFSVAGRDLPVTQPAQETIVLGEDRAGDQTPLRERMRPLLVFFVLLVESFALASLVGSEIQQRTVTAMLVTPARTGDILAAKGITGTVLAFGQGVVLLVAIRAFGPNPAALLVAVLLGSVLAAGVGMIAGSAGRDFMTTLFIGMIFMVALAIPAFALMFPGSASTWVKVIPSYGVVQAIYEATSLTGGWRDMAPHLLMALAWCVVVFGLGLIVLKRRVEAL